MKKKKELPMKLLDDLKILTARRNSRRPHHSHKPLDVAARWVWSRGDLIARGATTTTWAPPLQTLTLKTENEALKTIDGALPLMRAEIHHASMAQRPQGRGNLRRHWREAGVDPIAYVAWVSQRTRYIIYSSYP
jgi:hypothetical protein